MSLIDWDNPNHLQMLKRSRRARDPQAPLEPDLFCQACEEPLCWCHCKEPRHDH